MKDRINIYNGVIGIAIGLFIIGTIFKAMHWPNGNDLIIIALAAIVNVYFLKFWFKKDKQPLDYAKVALIGLGCLTIIFGILHWPGKILLQLLTGFTFIAFVFLGGSRSLFGITVLEGKNPRFNFSSYLISIAGILIIIGALFKIMHWPFGTYMLLAGLGLGIIWFLKDSFNNKSEE